MVDRKDRFALISKFKKFCKDSGKPVPQINMNVEQWAADSLIESYGLARCYDIMDYYFKISHNPTWSKFTHHAGNLLDSMVGQEQDDALRLELRRKAQEWLQR